MSIFTATVPLRISIDFSLKWAFKWLLRAFLFFAIYTTYKFAFVMWKHFEFHGELRTLKAWNPWGDARHKRRRVAIVCPQWMTGEGLLRRHLIQSFKKKGSAVFSIGTIEASGVPSD